MSTRKRVRTESEETPKGEPEEANTVVGIGPPSQLESHTRAGHSEPTCDAEFWFSDGTIILIAQDVEFRFYRALLAYHSPVFRTMFTEQHPSRLVPIDGYQSFTCPVVTLPDSPQDLRHIFRAYVSGGQTRRVPFSLCLSVTC